MRDASRGGAGWRDRLSILLAVALALPLLVALSVPEPGRTGSGTLAASTMISWSGTAGIRLKVPAISPLPEDGVRLTPSGATSFAFVRLVPSPQPASCAEQGLDVCFVGEINWVRFVHGADAGALTADPALRRVFSFGNPSDVGPDHLDLYLFSDGPVTLQLSAPGLEGVASYRASGTVHGLAQVLPTSCLPVGCGGDGSLPDAGAGPTLAVGGAAHDVGELGYVASLGYSRNEPDDRTSVVRGVHPCVYPSVVDPQASADPDDHPLGCDEVPEAREGAVRDRLNATVGDQAGASTFQLEVWVSNPGASGQAYAGFRMDTVGTTPGTNVAYGLWFGYGIEQPVRSVTRLAGSSRQETAVAVSRHAFPAGADAVVIARADTFPDALAGAPLAYAEGAPVLLTGGGGLDAPVAEEIRRLGARAAVLLGGTGGLSVQVEDDLRSIGVSAVDRVAGASRWETAAAIAARVGGSEAFVVSAADPDRGWPDALAVSAIAARRGAVILLVAPDEIPAATRSALGEVSRVVIVGGQSAVSERVERELAAIVGQVDRIQGASRFATNVALLDRYGTGAGPIWVATGLSFPDALAAGPAVAATAGRLLLVDGADLDRSPDAARWYSAATREDVLLVGGVGALSRRLETQLRQR